MPAITSDDCSSLLGRRFQFTAKIMAGCAALIGLLALAGWYLRIEIFKRLLPGTEPIRPNLALILMLAAAALLLPPTSKACRCLSRAAGLLVLLVGTLSLFEYLSGINLIVDGLLLGYSAPAPALRISHLAALGASLLGLALLLFDWEPAPNLVPTQVLALLCLASSFLALLGYTFSAESLYSAGFNSRLSLPGALGLALLAMACLLVRPGMGYMSLASSPQAGGSMLRRLLPVAVAVPWVLGWLSLVGSRRGLYSIEHDQVFFAGPLIVCFALFVFFSSRSLERADGEREAHKREVERLNRELEERVQQRTAELAGAVGALQAEATGRQRTEQELRDKHTYTRSLIESSLDALATVDPAGKITDVNQQMEKLTGVPRAALIGTSFCQHFTDSERARQGVRLVLEQGRVTDYELTARARDGRQTPVIYNASTYFNQQGELQGVFAAARDIRERKQSEDQLRRSERRYRTLLETLPQKIAHKDRQSVFLSCNANFARDLGIQPAEITGKTDYDFFPKHLAEKYRADDRRVMESGQVVELEEEYSQDGLARDVNTVKAPVRNERGEVTGVIAIFWDITERKRAQRALRKSEQELALRHRIAQVFLTHPDPKIYGEVLNVILEASGSEHGLFGYIDEDGAIVYPSMNRVWDQCQIPGKTVRFPRETWGGIWGRAMIEKRSLYSNQPGHVPEGHVFIRRVLVVPIIYQGRLIGQFEVANKCDDYTLADQEALERIADYIAPVLSARLQRDSQEKARDAAEQEVRDLNRTLEDRVGERTAALTAANQELEAFSSCVSHDLRAPLRHIQSFSKLLLDGHSQQLDEEGRHYVERICDGGRRLSGLVDDLLNLSHISRQALQLWPTPLNGVVSAAMRELETSGREIEWKIGDLPTVRCDPRLMKQVFVNLLDNAMKFTRPCERAVIEVGISGPGTTIFVRDNGVGFDMQYVSRLFGIFQRLHHSAEFEGTGVGLATVARIIQKHGGRVWAESEPGRGATFYFTLGPAEAGSGSHEHEEEELACMTTK